MYYIIINPSSKSGQGAAIWKKLKKELNQHEVPYKYYFTKYEMHAFHIASKICMEHKGVKKIVILGGDGTVNEVINGINDYSKAVIGYIPTGSSNDLARSLHIPANPSLALKKILKGNYYKHTDMGYLSMPNKKRMKQFVVSAGAGFDAAVCYEALHSNIKTVLNKLNLGKLTYIAIALKLLFTYRPSDACVTVDKYKKYSFKNVYFIACMNSPYEGGGMRMAPSASLQDGKLDICVIHNISKLKILLLLPSLVYGFHTRFRGADVIRASSADIQFKQKQIIHSDGEYCGYDHKMSVSCLDHKLRFIQ